MLKNNDFCDSILNDTPEQIEKDLENRFISLGIKSRRNVNVNEKGIYVLPDIVVSDLDYKYIKEFKEEDFLV